MFDAITSCKSMLPFAVTGLTTNSHVSACLSTRRVFVTRTASRCNGDYKFM